MQFYKVCDLKRYCDLDTWDLGRAVVKFHGRWHPIVDFWHKVKPKGTMGVMINPRGNEITLQQNARSYAWMLPEGVDPREFPEIMPSGKRTLEPVVSR